MSSQCQFAFIFINNIFYLKEKNSGENVRSNDRPSTLLDHKGLVKGQRTNGNCARDSLVKGLGKSRHLVLD